MTVVLGRVMDRCKLRDLRYSRDLRPRTVAIGRFMGVFHLSRLYHQQNVSYVVRVPINHFWDSWTSTSWDIKSNFEGIIPERDTLIDVRKQQKQSSSDRKEVKGDHSRGSALADQGPTVSEQGGQSRDGGRNRSNLQPRWDRVIGSIQGGRSRRQD